MKKILFLLGIIVVSMFFVGERSRRDKISDFTLKGTPFYGMTSEEFEQEMMKGVQGDFTLEQVDSMYKSWAEEDSI